MKIHTKNKKNIVVIKCYKNGYELVTVDDNMTPNTPLYRIY